MSVKPGQAQVHFLRTVAGQIEGLNNFIGRVTENPLTQGVVLDLNPLWFTAYSIAQAGLDLDSSSPGIRFLRVTSPWLGESLLGESHASGGIIDVHWTHPIVDFWNAELLGRQFGRNAPYLVKVITYPIYDADQLATRSRLIELVRSAPFPAIIETRERARLATGGGDPCVSVSGLPGTIGGFLRDANSGQVFGATCGHVVQPGPVTSKGVPIGQCVYFAPPVPLPAGQRCSQSHPNANRLDLALIDLVAMPSANTSSATAQVVYPRESIRVTGAVTGAHQYIVGGACMTYEIGGICYEHLFEVRHPISPGLLSAAFSTLLAAIPKQGDSGAWVERTSAPDWCGVVVAVDSTMAYALESDELIRAANSNWGMNLLPA